MTATQPSSDDVFMNLIVAFLTPMFLSATGGDLERAHATAMRTVNAYTRSDPDDLLLIAQSIALGLAVLSSISLSMAENIPTNLVLRLRGNAANLHRAAGQCRQALAASSQEAIADQTTFPEIDQQAQDALVAKVARTQQRVAEYQASLAQPKPAPARQILPPPEFADSPATMRAALAALQAESERRIAEAGIAMKTTGHAFPQHASHPGPAESQHHGATRSAMMAARQHATEIANLREARASGTPVVAIDTTAGHLNGSAPPHPMR